MRLVTYRHDGEVRTGAIVGGDAVVDLRGIADADDLTPLLSDPEALAAAADRVASAEGNASTRAGRIPLTEVELLAPVRPGKIVCLGYNYRGHVPDGAEPTANDPEYPDVFVKTPNTLAGPNEPVVIPRVSLDVDYEGEVALVIGRRAHHVALDDALDHVAGYTILNDVSDRAWQRRQSQWALGKCFDGFAPLGPWIVTPDEIDPQDLLVEVVREGRVTVSQSTSTTIFSAAYVVHYLSTVMTLEPGDVISTGTPQKLPEAQSSHRPLTAGDEVTVRIAGIGELTTTFIAPMETIA